MAKLEDVFGISIEPILSYISRPQVDGRFADALNHHHHIVIYGSSKQGKTALRQKHVKDDACTIVRCGPKMTTETIYQALLRDAGVRIKILETRTDSLTGGVTAKIGFKAMIPWIGGGKVETQVSGEKERQQELQTEFVGYDFCGCPVNHGVAPRRGL